MQRLIALACGLFLAAALAVAGDFTERTTFSAVDRNKDGMVTAAAASSDHRLTAHFE